MTLSDRDIIQEYEYNHSGISSPLIDPFIRENVQPASVDLTLADEFLHYPRSNHSEVIHLDRVKNNPVKMNWTKTHCFLLPPGGFVLGRTKEWVNIPDYLVASVEGKSSLARLGLFVHVTAGFIDPGFSGTITLEFFNASPRREIGLTANVRICQIAFQKLVTPARRPYGSAGLGSKYQNQERTTGSKYQG